MRECSKPHVRRHNWHCGLKGAQRPCRRRRELRKRLEAGDVDIVIGTTALNNAEELFSSLGLVIIDEQHRFGVRQRAQLVKKAPDAPPPHVLFMTATPIPRTIAMTLMSHMTTSVINELPPGRLPVRYAPSPWECDAVRCPPTARSHLLWEDLLAGRHGSEAGDITAGPSWFVCHRAAG